MVGGIPVRAKTPISGSPPPHPPLLSSPTDVRSPLPPREEAERSRRGRRGGRGEALGAEKEVCHCQCICIQWNAPLSSCSCSCSCLHPAQSRPYVVSVPEGGFLRQKSHAAHDAHALLPGPQPADCAPGEANFLPTAVSGNAPQLTPTAHTRTLLILFPNLQPVRRERGREREERSSVSSGPSRDSPGFSLSLSFLRSLVPNFSSLCSFYRRERASNQDFGCRCGPSIGLEDSPEATPQLRGERRIGRAPNAVVPGSSARRPRL